MTISSSNRVAGPFPGDGVTNTPLPFTFKIFATSDIQVIQTTDLGVDSVLVGGYSVNMNVDQDTSPGGTVQMTVATALNYKITLTTALPYTQAVKVTLGGAFLPTVFNTVFDRLTVLIQQVLSATTRSIVAPVSDGLGIVTTLPTILQRASKMLAFDAGGNVVASNLTLAQIEAGSSSAAAAAVSAASALTSANTATAQATLAVNAAISTTNLWCTVSGGTADAINLTPSAAVGAYAIGQKYRWLNGASASTSAAPTFNVSGLGNVTLFKTIGMGLVQLAGNDIPASAIIEVEMVTTNTAQIVNIRPLSQGADIATAATVNLNTATGVFIRLTGAVTVNAITLAQGQYRRIYLVAGATFTNGANLLCPFGVNFVGKAGDYFDVLGLASGVVQILDVWRAAQSDVQADLGLAAAIIASNNTNLGFSKKSDSGNVTIAAVSTVTIPHTLGVLPVHLQWFLVCTTTDSIGGWTAGDILPWCGPYGTDDNGVGSYGFSARITTTNIIVDMGVAKYTTSGTGSPNPRSPVVIDWTKYKLRVISWG